MTNEYQHISDELLKIKAKISELEDNMNLLKTPIRVHRLKAASSGATSACRTSAYNNDLENIIANKILKEFANSIKERMPASFAQLF